MKLRELQAAWHDGKIAKWHFSVNVPLGMPLASVSHMYMGLIPGSAHLLGTLARAIGEVVGEDVQ